MNACCDISDRNIDVDCEYENGGFKFLKLPHCLPERFTVRFKAPADFNAGDVIVIQGVEMPVMTSQMEAADSEIFKAGAVMMCEIDRDRNLAFIRTGGASGTSGSGEEVEFQTLDLVYYIDPLGDDSPNNTGAVDSPFKTLAGAGRAAWQNIVMNPLGTLVFSFNPGTYNLSTEDHLFMTETTHPRGIIFKATDLSNKPLTRASHFRMTNGKREFQGLRLDNLNSPVTYLVSACANATLFLSDSEIIANQPLIAIQSNSGGFLRIVGMLTINGNGYSVPSILSCHHGTLWTWSGNITFDNFSSVSSATVHCNAGQMFLNRTSFSGAVSGKRYSVTANGIVNTTGEGPNFIPGTIAGTTTTGGQYL